jgi:hypothetical protein
MDEYEVPEWLLRAAQEVSAYARQMAPMLKAAQQAADALQPYLPLIRDVLEAMQRLGPALPQPLPPPPPELLHAMNAGLLGMLSPSWQQWDAVVHGTVGTVSVRAPAGSVCRVRDTIVGSRGRCW